MEGVGKASYDSFGRKGCDGDVIRRCNGWFPPATCRSGERVASTTKKLEKTAFVGNYLQQLDDADRGHAARYFASHQFAQNDARTTNVGGSSISTALGEATGLSFEELAPIYVRLGDAAKLQHEAVREAKRFHHPTMGLVETKSIMSRLSETRGIKNMTSLLTAVLSHARPLEAR